MWHILFVVLVLGWKLADAQAPDTLWTRLYGAPYGANGYTVSSTSDGGLIVSGTVYNVPGYSTQMYLARTNHWGDTLWSHLYGGPFQESTYSCIVASDGGIMIVGEKSGDAVHSNTHVVRTNASGDTLWTKTYDLGNTSRANSVRQIDDGGFVLAGWSEVGGGLGIQALLIRTDSTGDTLWTRMYGGTGGENAQSLCGSNDGGFVIAGSTDSFDSLTQMYLVRVDAEGNEQWAHRYGVENAYAFGYTVVRSLSGGYAVAGYTSDGVDADALLVRVNEAGEVIWLRTYGGDGPDYGKSIVETIDGGFSLAGESLSFGSMLQYYLVRMDANGDSIWTSSFGGGLDDFCRAVEQMPDGGFVLAGTMRRCCFLPQQIYVIRLCPESPPVSPYSVTIMTRGGQHEVELSWPPVTSTESGLHLIGLVYRIERSQTPDFASIVLVGMTQDTSFTDSSASESAFYRIIAVSCE